MSSESTSNQSIIKSTIPSEPLVISSSTEIKASIPNEPMVVPPIQSNLDSKPPSSSSGPELSIKSNQTGKVKSPSTKSPSSSSSGKVKSPSSSSSTGKIKSPSTDKSKSKNSASMTEKKEEIRSSPEVKEIRFFESCRKNGLDLINRYPVFAINSELSLKEIRDFLAKVASKNKALTCKNSIGLLNVLRQKGKQTNNTLAVLDPILYRDLCRKGYDQRKEVEGSLGSLAIKSYYLPTKAFPNDDERKNHLTLVLPSSLSVSDIKNRLKKLISTMIYFGIMDRNFEFRMPMNNREGSGFHEGFAFLQFKNDDFIRVSVVRMILGNCTWADSTSPSSDPKISKFENYKINCFFTLISSSNRKKSDVSLPVSSSSTSISTSSNSSSTSISSLSTSKSEESEPKKKESVKILKSKTSSISAFEKENEKEREREREKSEDSEFKMVESKKKKNLLGSVKSANLPSSFPKNH